MPYENANTNNEMCKPGKLPNNLQKKVATQIIKEKKHIKPHQVFVGLSKK
tara:strand:- start:368 stop:517 length:150 start_codon:yes stop_codon:yes gene_type:complete